MSNESKVELISCDNFQYEVDLAIVQESRLIVDTVETTGDYAALVLPDVPDEILRKVIDYCTYHAQFKIRSDKNVAITEDEIKEWDAAFVSVDHPTLVGLINAAHYMDIQSLLLLMCERVRHLIIGKTPEQIRRTFGIADDLSPEEKEEIRRHNSWAYLH
ncbi:unnamed protein product [Calypogeia fissa]